MVAALFICLAYLFWMGLGLCLPPYIAGRYPASLLGRVYNEKSCMFDGESKQWLSAYHSRCKGDCGSYSYRWMLVASAVFPPAIACFAALGAVALVCVVVYEVCSAIGSVPKKLELVGEKHRTEKLLPKASVRDEQR